MIPKRSGHLVELRVCYEPFLWFDINGHKCTHLVVPNISPEITYLDLYEMDTVLQTIF